jgi:hypothetical protein
VEPRLELSAVVGLQDEYAEREPFFYCVEESYCCALVAGIVDLQYSDARTVVDGGELIELFGSVVDIKADFVNFFDYA